jgi:hypothetical protein
MALDWPYITQTTRWNTKTCIGLEPSGHKEEGYTKNNLEKNKEGELQKVEQTCKEAKGLA